LLLTVSPVDEIRKFIRDEVTNISKVIKVKLSETQKRTLERMKEGKWYTSYQLGIRISTLLALEQKGLVERKKDELIWFGWEGGSMHFRKVSD